MDQMKVCQLQWPDNCLLSSFCIRKDTAESVLIHHRVFNFTELHHTNTDVSSKLKME